MREKRDQHVNSSDQIKEAKAIRFLAFLFILRGVYSLIGNLNFDYYHFMFQQLPEQWIKIRYFCTLAIRVTEITLGVGLWLKKDMFRKVAICLCLLSLVLIYWKHPFFVFHNIAVRAEYGVLDTAGATTLKYPQFPVISMIFYYAVDIVFYLLAAFYLLNPKVKKEFQPEG